jgi:hypothetical protein
MMMKNSLLEQQLAELKSLMLQMRSEMNERFDAAARETAALRQDQAERYVDLRERISINNDKLSAMQRDFDRLRRDIENPDRFTLKP